MTTPPDLAEQIAAVQRQIGGLARIAPYTEAELAVWGAMLATLKRYERLEAVAKEAVHGWDRLQEMYNGQDNERRATGEVGSLHRDKFEDWLDTLTTDALAALAALAAAAPPTHAGSKC